MIVVTGATGQLGTKIVESLAKRIPPAQIGVSVRDPEKAKHFADLGIRVRQGDFTAPETLLTAFEGAEQVLLVSSNARARGEDVVAQHKDAIDAAKTVGAKRILYTSHMAASHESLFPPMHDHARTEDLLRACGVPWVSLRNGFYADSAILFMGNAFESGQCHVPANGKVAWTSHQDIAKATAAILCDDTIEGPTPPLTGSEVLDFNDLASIATALLGKPIQCNIISDQEFEARATARGMPQRAVAVSLGFFKASHQLEFASSNATLEQLIGQRPMSMREVFARHLETLTAHQTK